MKFEFGNYPVLVLGILIGLALGIVIGMWFPPATFQIPEECGANGFWCFLDRWQTLVAGAIALVAAGIAWKSVERQISYLRSVETKKDIADIRAKLNDLVSMGKMFRRAINDLLSFHEPFVRDGQLNLNALKLCRKIPVRVNSGRLAHFSVEIERRFADLEAFQNFFLIASEAPCTRIGPPSHAEVVECIWHSEKLMDLMSEMQNSIDREISWHQQRFSALNINS